MVGLVSLGPPYGFRLPTRDIASWQGYDQGQQVKPFVRLLSTTVLPRIPHCKHYYHAVILHDLVIYGKRMCKEDPKVHTARLAYQAWPTAS